MLGAIIGDIVGSRWEFDPTNDYDFEMFSSENSFTDDTVCTIAVADAIAKGRDYGESIHEWCRRYPFPMGGYGGRFRQWVMSDKPKPYGSFGNGSAMRVSPVAWHFNTAEDVLREARLTAECTHNHPEGILGAEATALAIFECRQGRDISAAVEYAGYDININKADVENRFDETCQGTVPVAFWIIRQSTSFEDALRRAVSLGADADTLGAIVGSIAEARWGIPDNIRQKAMEYLPEEMKYIIITVEL